MISLLRYCIKLLTSFVIITICGTYLFILPARPRGVGGPAAVGDVD